MNLQNIKKNSNNSRAKKNKNETTNKVKNNKTMLGESNQINKDLYFLKYLLNILHYLFQYI